MTITESRYDIRFDFQRGLWKVVKDGRVIEGDYISCNNVIEEVEKHEPRKGLDMSLFNTLPKDQKIILRRINSLGEALQKGGNQFKIASIQAELSKLCIEINIDVNDVLSIYLSESRISA